MRPIRTLMFVPGHKEKWIEKIPTFGADAVVLDLEVSVPGSLKILHAAWLPLQSRNLP